MTKFPSLAIISMVVKSDTIIIAVSSRRTNPKRNLIAIISSSDKTRKEPYLEIGIRLYT